MNRITNSRAGGVPSLATILPLLSKFSNGAAGLLPRASKALLYLMGLLVLVNLNSFPFIWHCESPLSRSPYVH